MNFTKYILLFLAVLLSFTIKSNTVLTHKDCDKECLTKVFNKGEATKKQIILKLYCNNDYELIYLSKTRRKSYEKLEQGKFTQIGSIIKFTTENKFSLIHKDYLFLRKEKLYSSLWNMLKHNNHYLISENDIGKYIDSTYVDRFFGVISNEKGKSKKLLNLPKYKWYKTYPEKENTIVSLDRLKVVLVVGEREEEEDAMLNRTIELKNHLLKKGVNVQLFKPPASWEAIVENSKNAHVFLYAGHGDGDGFYLAGGSISSERIKQDLKLHPKAIILFNHVCYGAGSSASDRSKISDEEATLRVQEYAKTFIEIGAGGYYANNANYSMLSFFDSFCNQNPLKNIVMNGRWSADNVIVTEELYKYNDDFEIMVTCDESYNGYSTVTTYTNGVKSVKKIKSFPSYSVAYVGIPDLTIADLLQE